MDGKNHHYLMGKAVGNQAAGTDQTGRTADGGENKSVFLGNFSLVTVN